MQRAEQPTDPERQALCEQRAEPRWPCRRSLACRLLLRPSWRRRYALLLNLSATGVALFLPVRLEVGQGLALRLPLARGDSAGTHRGKVVYIRHRRDGGFVHGCRLDAPLAEDELATLA